MARMMVTRVGRVVRVEVGRDLPRVRPTLSIVAGPSRATIERPWVAMVGSHAHRPRLPEVIVLSSSSDSDSDSSSDRTHLYFRRTRQQGVIVLSDTDMCVSPRWAPCIMDVGPTSESHVCVGPAGGGVACEKLYDGDGAFGNPFDVGPVVLDPVDVDDVFDGVVDVGSAVDVGVDSFDGPVEGGPTIGISLDEDDAYDRPLEAGLVLNGGPAEVGPTLRRVFRRNYDVVDISLALERFSPLRGECTNIEGGAHLEACF